jgi:hypothetical protein
MKFCPICMTGFSDRVDTCPAHGGYLSEIVDLQPGMVIRSACRIVRKPGEGSFGSVYLAQQVLMDEPRAARFWCEVRTLRHRNVVGCGDLERDEDESMSFPWSMSTGRTGERS